MRLRNSRMQCLKCEHYSGDGTCKAFPKKIPRTIFSGIQNHDEVLDNQVGTFVYVPLEIYRESELKRVENDRQLILNYEMNKKLLADLILEEINNNKNINKRNFEAIHFVGIMTNERHSSIKLYLLPEVAEIKFDDENLALGRKIFFAFRAVADTQRILTGYYQKVDLTVYTNSDFFYDEIGLGD